MTQTSQTNVNMYLEKESGRFFTKSQEFHQLNRSRLVCYS